MTDYQAGPGRLLISVPLTVRECGLLTTLLRTSAQELTEINGVLAGEMEMIASTIEVSTSLEVARSDGVQ